MRYAAMLGTLTGMLTVAALLAGCGGGGSGGGGSDPAATGATQAPASGNDSAATAPDPAARSGPLYDRDPILASCDPGVFESQRETTRAEDAQ